jgi:AcrR family transcriptional regulator
VEAATSKGLRTNTPIRQNVKAPVKSEETRVRILNAALDMFREKDFESTTMREIAIRAGLVTGAAYYYFASKDTIVFSFYRQATACGPRTNHRYTQMPGWHSRSETHLFRTTAVQIRLKTAMGALT